MLSLSKYSPSSTEPHPPAIVLGPQEMKDAQFTASHPSPEAADGLLAPETPGRGQSQEAHRWRLCKDVHSGQAVSPSRPSPPALLREDGRARV